MKSFEKYKNELLSTSMECFLEKCLQESLDRFLKQSMDICLEGSLKKFLEDRLEEFLKKLLDEFVKYNKFLYESQEIFSNNPWIKFLWNLWNSN